MRHLAPLLMLAVLMLGACACSTRDKPSDILDSNRRGSAQVTAPGQDTNKVDAQTGAAIADSDGDANMGIQKVGVDVQAPNQATGAQFAFAPLMGATNALATTYPGEAYVLKQLDRTGKNIDALEARLADDPTLTAADRDALNTKLGAARVAESEALARLDGYAAKKLEAAKALAPDLSGLRQVVYAITSHQTAGNDVPNITDAQADAIARVAEKAVETTVVGGGE